VLIFDGAGRRSARDVRCECGAAGAATDALNVGDGRVPKRG